MLLSRVGAIGLTLVGAIDLSHVGAPPEVLAPMACRVAGRASHAGKLSALVL